MVYIVGSERLSVKDQTLSQSDTIVEEADIESPSTGQYVRSAYRAAIGQLA